MPNSGSKKQSQRTKGNVKPSSSSHAANLLVGQGTAPTTGFIGFGQGPKYVPASETLDDMDTSLDSDFRMVLRKLTKRDSVTKIKSLQEFSDICGIKEEDSIKAVLPFWPRIYNKMTMDIDYRVREAAQHAMSTLVKKAGRNVAPYLKTMMGPWLLNQCDTYPTVASSAQLAFSNSFSPHKQKDAWSFCKDNIIEYLSDNILKQTPQSLSDPKATDPEDMENKYTRVLTCSLLAVRKLLQSLPPEQVESLTEPLKTILEDPKFWKHGKHKSNMVKGAIYGCISGLCQSQPEVCGHYVNKMAPLVLHNLDEKDPVIISNLWEAALSLVNYLPECWQHINAQKGFMPKLKNVLENGCHGNAVVIGPSLLPFISKVPPDLLPDSNKFFQDFFIHSKNGLSISSVQVNRSECNALVRAYMECAQYVVMKEATSSTVLVDQVLPLVESSLLEDSSQLHKTPLYSMVSQLLGPAHKCQTVPGAADFWNHLSGTMLDALETSTKSALGGVTSTEQRTRTAINEKLLSLVRTLYYPDLVLTEKSGKVTFKTDEDIDKSFSEMKLNENTQKQILGEPAARFVHRLIQQAFKSAYNSNSSDSLQLLSVLLEIDKDGIVPNMIQCVKDGSITESLQEGANVGDVEIDKSNNSVNERDILNDTESTAESFIFDICIKWLVRLQTADSGRDLKNVINIISLFVDSLDSDGTVKLMVELNEVILGTEGFYILLEKLLSLCDTVVTVQEWVRGPVLGSRLVAVVVEVCTAGQNMDSIRTETSWNILSLALTSSKHGELMISEETVEGLLKAVLGKMSQLDWGSDQADTDIKNIARATQGYFSHKVCLKSASSIDLLVNLYNISVSKEEHLTAKNEAMQQDMVMTPIWQQRLMIAEIADANKTKELLQSVWSSGFSCVFRDTTNPVRAAEVWSRAADIVTGFVDKLLGSLQKLQGILTGVRELLSVMLNSSNSNDVMTLCSQLFVDVSTQVPAEVWEYLCVRGTYPDVPIKGQPCASWTRTLYTTLYNIKLLDIARSLGDASADSEVDGSCGGESEDLFWTKEVLVFILKCFQGHATVEMSLQVHEQTQPSSVIPAAKELKTTLFSLVENMNRETHTNLWELLLATYDREPDYCLSVPVVTASLRSRKEEMFLIELSHIADRCSSLTASHHYLIYSCLLSMAPADILTLSQIFTAQVLSWTPDQDIFNGNVGILSLISDSVLTVIDQYDTEAKEMMMGTLDQILVVKENREDAFLYSRGCWVCEGDVYLGSPGHPTDIGLQLDQACYPYSSNLSESAITEVLINADIARFLGSVVEQMSDRLTDKHWDFILCSLASWIQSLEESRSGLLSSVAVKTFAISTCNLVVQVSKCVANIGPDRGYPDNLVTEWNEFFSESVFSALLPIYVEICGSLKTQSKAGASTYLLTAICSAISYCPSTCIKEHKLPALFIVDDTSSFPDELQTLVNHVGPLMLHRNRATQLSAWHLLNRIIGDLPAYDKEDKGSTEEIASDHQEPTARGPPLFLLRVIDDCSETVHELLEDTEIYKHRTVKPDETGYHHIVAYLLSWQLIVNFFTSAPAQIRQEYARYLEEHHLVEILMWSLFKLMPANPDKMFDISPNMSVKDPASSSEIQHISCNLYKLALKNMPAMVRNWWKNCDRKTAAYVDKFTTKNVSSILCVQEIQSVNTTGKQLDGMTIKTRPATREVLATYCLGEVTIEMVITLPPNYPLGPISVKSEKRVGVSAQQWEKWLLQLNIFLQYQNGNVIDGLELWKNNIDKKFEGVDDCMICFSVLHGTNFQLPRITCKTCKKKFHSACLYKWFSTSHNSTCPLCRNIF